MKKLLFILLAATSLVACKKNNDAQPGNSTDISDKVKKSIYSSGYTNYAYDNSGRIKTKTFQDGAKEEFEYQPGKILEKSYDAGGVLLRTYTYELNADGIVERETRSNKPGFQTIRIYNGDKQVIKYTDTYNGGTSSGDYFYSNGNCDSLRLSSNGTWFTTIKMTYYTDKVNSLDYTQSGQSFWGKKSKNLQKSEQYFSSNGTIDPAEIYTYELDSKGRVTKHTTTVDGDIFITQFNY